MPHEEPNIGERKRTRAAAKMQRKSKRRHRREKEKSELKEIKDNLIWSPDRLLSTLISRTTATNSGGDCLYGNFAYWNESFTGQRVIRREATKLFVVPIPISACKPKTRCSSSWLRLVLAQQYQSCTNFAQWPEAIQDRTLLAHSVCADDVLGFLPFASPDMSIVLERGFELIFGRHPVQWENATLVERTKRVPA